jgi:uncharacterized RDD family membrane protein YckC
MSAAAQQEQPGGESTPHTEGANAGALRQLAAERLAAHRNRRAAILSTQAPIHTPIQAPALTEAAPTATRRPAAKIATTPAASAHPSVRDAVVARYQRSQSYQEFLALESERALQKAQAEAEIAARNAAAVADAQRRLLEEIDHWNQTPPEPVAAPDPQPLFIIEPAIPLDQNPIAPNRELIAREVIAPAFTAPALITPESTSLEPTAERITEAPPAADFILEQAPAAAAPHARRSRSTGAIPAAPLTVQLFSDLPQTFVPPTHGPVLPDAAASYDPAELEELEDEIAFRLAPEFEDLTLETVAIPANLIEFPRQLVAPRKARPRLAEGPLREDIDPGPQLRIFEVEPGQISADPAIDPSTAPEWQSLHLPSQPHLDHDPLRPTGTFAATYTEDMDAAVLLGPELDPARNIAPAASGLIHAAPVSRRVMAMLVDSACVGAAFVGFCVVAARLCGPQLREMANPALAATAALALVVLAALYQVLFFWFNEATPGMVYARLCFCTFAEGNPTRSAVRRRLIATAIAICPLGLGLLWMALDPDRLGWHDRISRMYPRAY